MIYFLDRFCPFGHRIELRRLPSPHIRKWNWIRSGIARKTALFSIVPIQKIQPQLCEQTKPKSQLTPFCDGKATRLARRKTVVCVRYLLTRRVAKHQQIFSATYKLIRTHPESRKPLPHYFAMRKSKPGGAVNGKGMTVGDTILVNCDTCIIFCSREKRKMLPSETEKANWGWKPLRIWYNISSNESNRSPWDWMIAEKQR